MYTDIGFHVEDKNIVIQCNTRHLPATEETQEFSTMTIEIIDVSEGFDKEVGSAKFYVNGDLAALKSKFASVLEALT